MQMFGCWPRVNTIHVETESVLFVQMNCEEIWTDDMRANLREIFVFQKPPTSHTTHTNT